MNQPATLALVLAVGLAGGALGSILFSGPAADTAGDLGVEGTAGIEAALRDIEDRMLVLERNSESNDMAVSALESRFAELAEATDRGPAAPEAVGPNGEPMGLAAGDLPTGRGFDMAVAAVIEQREAQEAEERRQRRAEQEAERVERRVEELAAELGLDSRQQEQMAKVLVDANVKRDELRNQMREENIDWRNAEEREAAMERFTALNDETNQELGNFLSAEQLSQYQESTSNAMGGWGRGATRGGGGNAGGGNNGGRGNRGNGF